MIGMCERRKSAAERRLLTVRRERQAIDAERDRLQRTIDLIVESGRVAALDERVVDRGGLYDWLRRGASLRHRTQMLRVELEQNDGRASDCDRRIDAHLEACRVAENKRERYADAHRKVNARIRRMQLNAEESELEERKSWLT
ncbi:hypothetical protein DB771_14635 [Burkholderia sp. AU29985]|nr:hypothetical protein XM57_21845 [Burkholderia cepacia]AYZ94362.1 hypothetical protein EGY28_04380 [Burkholderia dolosa]ETP63868.1 hypothetical protein BDSB_25705 [Burkholderia dolosa PC543]PRE51723.1 hypothetical protein C6P87_10015 [Burkholderia sp. AU12872]PUA76165.1 hypothetical protein DB771_14635 [Burkholderia sp. AU29985]